MKQKNLMEKKIVGTFYEKSIQKINQTEFRVEKVIRRKRMSKGKAMIIPLAVRLIKMISLDKVNYFPEPHTHSK